MRITLEFLGGQTTGFELPIRSDRFRIGRDSQCDLRPTSRQVSRNHCELVQRQGRAFLRDLNSTNGTYLNEAAVEGETPVRDGDAIRVGMLAFVLKISESDEATPAASQSVSADGPPAAWPCGADEFESSLDSAAQLAGAYSNDVVVKTLNELIATCKDSETEFRNAIVDLESVDLKAALNDCAQQRAEFAVQLEQRVIRRGGTPRAGGTVAGALLRVWLEIKSAFMGWREHVVLSDCDRAEHITLRHYAKALNRNLPGDDHEVIERQCDEIQRTHRQIHALALGSE